MLEFGKEAGYDFFEISIDRTDMIAKLPFICIHPFSQFVLHGFSHQ